MPFVIRPDEPGLPPATAADDHGLVALGGDLSIERLLLAYRTGIFPWYSEGLPIHWHSPPERFVLEPAALHVSRSLSKQLRRAPYRISMDSAFDAVIAECARARRPGQWGTWITGDMIAAYGRLHAAGWAHSIEAWAPAEDPRAGEQLVGGLYGVCIGAMFCGESMFALAPDASKLAFVHGVRQMQRWGVQLIDAQVHTEHLERFGAVEWPRSRFLARLAELRDAPGPSPGRWAFDEDFDPGSPGANAD